MSTELEDTKQELGVLPIRGHSSVTYRSREWGVSDFPGENVTKMYGSTLLPLQGGGGVCQISRKKRYVTLE